MLTISNEKLKALGQAKEEKDVGVCCNLFIP